MAEPAPLLCLPSASTSAPFTPLRSNWTRFLPGNLHSPRTASAYGALSCSVPPQVRHPSVPAELISGRLSSSPLQVVARRLGRLTFALRACCRSLLRGSLTQELRAAGSPPPTFAASSQVPSPSLPSHACRKLVHSAARPCPVKARFAGNPYSAAAPSAARSRSAWVPTLRRLRISPLAPLRPGRPSSPPLPAAPLPSREPACVTHRLRRLRQNPFRAHSAPPARTGAGSLWFRLQATCPFTPAGSWRSADSTASLRRPLPGQIALRLDSGYAPFRATCFRSAIPPLPSLPLRPPTAGPSPVRSRRAPLLQIALQCALHKGVLPLRPSPPPGPSSTRFRQTFAGSGLARSLRSSRGARLRPPIRPRGLHLHRFRHIRAESSSIPPLVLCPVRPASLGSAGSPVLCFADPPPAVPVPQAPSERPPARLFPAHPTVLSLYSAAFRCAALRRGAPTSRFRVGRRRVSAPFRSAPGKNCHPISIHFASHSFCSASVRVPAGAALRQIHFRAGFSTCHPV